MLFMLQKAAPVTVVLDRASISAAVGHIDGDPARYSVRATIVSPARHENHRGPSSLEPCTIRRTDGPSENAIRRVRHACSDDHAGSCSTPRYTTARRCSSRNSISPNRSPPRDGPSMAARLRQRQEFGAEGIRRHQSCARSYWCANRRSMASAKGRAAICRLIGSDRRSKPQGNAIAGSPVRLNG